MSMYVSRNEDLKAERILTMQTVMKHASYKSNAGKLELLSQAYANKKWAKEKLVIVQELEKKLEAKHDQLKKA